MAGNKRSSYRIMIEGGVICVIDLNGEISVADDAAQIIVDLISSGNVFERLLYRDKKGVWNEILVKSGRFLGLNLLNQRQLNKALRKIGY